MRGAHAIAGRLVALMGASTVASASWAACNVSVTVLPFNVYNPANASATDATGTVTVTCTVLVGIAESWTVKLSKGTSTTYSPRVLLDGVATLNYNIYTTNARTTIWGDGSGGTDFISDSRLLVIGSNSYSYTMYGRIPPLQDARAGAYSDTIVVTLSY